MTFDTWGCQPHAPAAFTPRKYSWYSFSLEAESTPGPWYGRKEYIIPSVICLTTGPKPPPKRFLNIVRYRASSLKWEYPLLSLRSSNSFLRLLPHLLVTSSSPFIFPSITCFRRQFLRKMWPIQLAFRFLISCSIFTSLFLERDHPGKIIMCTSCTRTLFVF